MWHKLSKTKKLLYIGVISCSILLGFCFSYLTSYLPSNDIALLSLQSSESVSVVETKDTITFTPLTVKSDTALIYYPGGKVDPSSFAYAAHAIAESGILVIIQKMPFNLAIFGVDSANKIIKSNPQISNWYLSGFSLGGTSASMYASQNKEKIVGLILYASYTTKSASLADANFPVISISGSEDGLATPSDISKAKLYLPQSTTFIEIQGGNHTQMALYNSSVPQNGDHVANITDLEQQEILIQESVHFIKKNSN